MKLGSSILFVFLWAVVFVNAHPSHPKDASLRQEELTLKLLSNSSLFDKFVRVGKKTLISAITDPEIKRQLRNVLDTDISELCREHMISYMRGLFDLKIWAWKMADATGIPSGMFSMSGVFPGSYDQCLSVVKKNSARSKVLFKGAYCSLHFRATLPPENFLEEIVGNRLDRLQNVAQHLVEFQFHEAYKKLLYLIIGVCIPSTCSQKDLSTIIEAVVPPMVNVSIFFCTKEENSRDVSLVQKIVGSLLVMYVLFVLSTSSLGQFKQKFRDESFLHKFLQCFSPKKSFQNIFQKDARNPIACLHGIRFLSVVWIVFCHSNFFYLISSNHLIDGVGLLSKEYQIFWNAFLSLDTFFLMGGVLVTYSVLGMKRKVNWVLFIVYRLFRILPGLIGFYMLAVLSPIMTSGPLSRREDIFTKPCEKIYWPSFLLLGNWFNFAVKCANHLWYLEADMQLFLLSPIIIFPLIRWPKIGLFLNALLIPTSVLTVGALTAMRNYPAHVFFNLEPTSHVGYMNKIHVKPYTYLASYSVGIYVGYIMATKRKLTLGLISRVAGWTYSTITCLLVLTTTFLWRLDEPAHLTHKVFYAAMHRFLWALAIGWIILACKYGYGGWVNKLLCLKFWKPLSQLSFSIYLIHPVVLFVYHSNLKAALYPGTYEMIWNSVGTLAFSIAGAIFLSVLFEQPYLTMSSTLLRPKQKKKEVQISTMNVEFQNPAKNDLHMKNSV